MMTVNADVAGDVVVAAESPTIPIATAVIPPPTVSPAEKDVADTTGEPSKTTLLESEMPLPKPVSRDQEAVAVVEAVVLVAPVAVVDVDVVADKADQALKTPPVMLPLRLPKLLKALKILSMLPEMSPSQSLNQSPRPMTTF